MLHAGTELLQVNAFEVQKSFNVIWNNGNDVIDRFWKCFDLTGENALRSINKKVSVDLSENELITGRMVHYHYVDNWLLIISDHLNVN